MAYSLNLKKCDMNDNFFTPVQFLLHWASETPNAIALCLNNTEYSYAQVFLMARAKAGFLEAHGVGSGTMCAVYTDDEEEFFFSLFGIWLVGGICIPMNIAQKKDKLQQMEKSVQPEVGFFSKEYDLEYERIFPMYLLEKKGDIVGECRQVLPADRAIVMFTSGTSGVPKAVPMTFKAICHNAYETAALINVKSSDKLLVNTPPYTTSSIIHVLTMMSKGAATVVDRGFLFGSGIIDQICKYECSGFGGVPVHFSRLLAALAEKNAPDSLRFLINSGDHLPVPVLKNIKKQIPDIEFYCIYGLTEVAGRLCVLPHEKVLQKSGSVGVPLVGMTVTIRDAKGEELDTGKLGEVFVQGKNVMTGYLNNIEANKKSMTKNGFATGDFGYLDEDGCLFLQGRSDDIFKVGGEKVSCKMIEDAIFGIDCFADFLVTPEYDEHLGQVPCLYYVTKKDGFKRKQLLRELRKILPHTHIPACFVQVDKIPRTSSGKPIKNILSEL